MARIQAGSTLVNQYAPPFVVSDSVAQGWKLCWSDTLKAFEAIDPDANTIIAGFDEIQVYERVLLGTEQRFTLPWAADSRKSLIVTIDGVKQHQDAYTASSDTVTNTTILTLSEPVFANQELEVLGLQTIGGAGVEVFGPRAIDGTTVGTVDSYYDLNWLAPSAESLIVTIDGVKQRVSNYNIEPVPGSNFTATRLTFPDREITFNILDNSGNGSISGINGASEVITTGNDNTRIAHGFTTGQSVYYSLNGGSTNVGLGLASGVIYYVNAIGAYTLSLHTTSADAINDVSRVDLTFDNIANETHSLTTITDPFLYINEDTIQIVNEGTGYAINDILLVEGGSAVSKAQLRVTDIGDQAQFTIDTDGAGTVSNVTLVDGGSGYVNGAGLTFTITDLTLAGGDDAVIQYDVIGGEVVGPIVLTPGTGYTISQAGIAVNTTDAPDPNAGNIKEVALTFAGEYVVFPSNAVSTTGSGNEDATFNVFAISPQLEVIGITETGQTPASPVNVTNLGNGVELFSSKAVSGDAQILSFKSLAAGTNITLDDSSGTFVTINAEQLPLTQSGAGGTTLFDNNDPSAAVLKTVQSANGRIALSTTGATPNEALAVGYNFGFKSISQVDSPYTVLPLERLISVSPAAATTVNLPVASDLEAGDTITIKDASGGAAANNITVTPDANDNINGALDGVSVVLNTARAYITLYSDGDNWQIIGQG